MNEEKTLYQQYVEQEHNNEVFKKLEKICADNEYKLFTAYKDGGRFYITIRSYCDLKGTRGYQPEIGYFYDFMKREGEFRISPWGLGSMDAEEFKNVIKGNQQALNIVKEAEKLDFNKLYEYPDD